MSQYGKICSRGLWDESVPGIEFDDDGISNYAHMFDKMCLAYPRGQEGIDNWKTIVEEMKSEGRNKKFDCIIGVSGGTDSSYLLHIAKQIYGLRPLAVTFDNGWSSNHAVNNIKKVTSVLKIELETYVVDYEEMKSIHKAYMKAGLPWIDTPTDFAIKNILLKTAVREKIKHILIGHDFRSEGTQPNEWTHGDSRQLNHILRQDNYISIKSFPYLNYYSQAKLILLNKIRFIKPYYFLEYQKKYAQDFLKTNYDWYYYGGHHHENLFTKFVISYWMPKKFNIDKRKITLSAQVLSGEISREEALEKIQQLPYALDEMERDKDYVIKKLGLSSDEFKVIWGEPNKSIYDYPSYLNLISKFEYIFKQIVRLTHSQKPTFLFQMEERKQKKN